MPLPGHPLPRLLQPCICLVLMYENFSIAMDSGESVEDMAVRAVLRGRYTLDGGCSVSAESVLSITVVTFVKLLT
jgi:hypothetical protein